MQQEQVVAFLRKKDFRLVKELGQGACGKTVLLYDEVIDENFVCKKYSPMFESMKEDLFSNFIREIKLLHMLNHANVVRVFNYYLYPRLFTGYILMELVDGVDVEDYLIRHPDQFRQVFIQMVEGFEHLEKSGILHRDIRPQNIMVNSAGVVKIIDFGFGKCVDISEGFDKSISLNWWCEPPAEFGDGVYDYRTEVYFVGKLLNKIILEIGVERFEFSDLLDSMCQPDPLNRIDSFSKIRQRMIAEKIADVSFTEAELTAYRDFAAALSVVVSKIERGAKYFSDAPDVERRLEKFYRSVMLESLVPSNAAIVGCFVNGDFFFKRARSFKVGFVKGFLGLLRSCSIEKKNIVLSNVFGRLDSVPRYKDNVGTDFLDDDIPF